MPSSRTADRLTELMQARAAPGAPVHPQDVLESLRSEETAFRRFNGWLADHVAALAGTMAFFHVLWLLIVGWAVWQSGILHNRGFDPYPYSFLFFILGGVMQSLFVPTMLTASNRAEERDRVKADADHRAQAHLYDVNDEQVELLREVLARLERLEARLPASES
ncbi:DUF1003 domain-containing protein [Tepidiforma sp.]|jgi:uncharacterized membrane protein|uniref:DUF1003 domain-containing protein n=1 Tax=Tepidiforma sp. TaxID=2682230 RepID=UPI002613B4D3|nr:DUF1003 domain-containing protein [Tepidiforma sp.]MCX7616759.1 DUF1003 domain-containing protein [Tepidiforma sp.]